MKKVTSAVLIGGSAGSVTVLIKVLNSLPDFFPFPIIIIIHRQRNVLSEMKSVLTLYSQKKQVDEPDDKEPIIDGCIYLAPQNYHLLIEEEKTFSLDYSEAVKFSRPSIDVSFESAANVYGSSVIAILLTGANNDGSEGLKAVIKNGGKAIVQDPATAEYPTMPKLALEKNKSATVLTPDKISEFLIELIKTNSV